MNNLLHLFKIPASTDLSQKAHGISSITTRINNSPYKKLLQYLDYFKNVNELSLLPKFDAVYKEHETAIKKNKILPLDKKENILAEIDICSHQFQWDHTVSGFKFDVNADLVRNSGFKIFFELMSLELGKLKTEDFNFTVYECEQKYTDYLPNKNNVNIIDFLEQIPEYKEQLRLDNIFKLIKNKHSLNNADLLKITGQSLQDLSYNYHVIKEIRLKLTTIIVKKNLKFCIEAKLDKLITKLDSILKPSRYVGLGVYRHYSNQTISKKAIPFSISCILDLTNFYKHVFYIVPIDIPKISKENISIDLINDTDIDEALIEQYSDKDNENTELTINLFKLEKLTKSFNEENIFVDKKLVDIEKWNSLIDGIIKEFNFVPDDYCLSSNIVFFEPSSDIKVLYEAYVLAVNTVLSVNDFSKKELESSLMYKMLYQKNDLCIESFDAQVHNLNNKDKTEIYGCLKENILPTKDKFDYYSLNVNQKIFTDKSLNHFEDEKSTGLSNVIALNGPPGTGKTTVLQTVVASVIVKSTLNNMSPPIIFGCSATNQAKNNIINGFKYSEVHSKNQEVTIYDRWINYIIEEEEGKYKYENIDYGTSLASDAPRDFNEFAKNMLNYKQELSIKYIDYYQNCLKQVLSSKQTIALEIISQTLGVDNPSYKLSPESNINDIVRQLNLMLSKVFDDSCKIENFKKLYVKKFEESIKTIQQYDQSVSTLNTIIDTSMKNQLIFNIKEKQKEIAEIKNITDEYNIKINKINKEFNSHIKQIEFDWNELVYNLKEILIAKRQGVLGFVLGDQRGKNITQLSNKAKINDNFKYIKDDILDLFNDVLNNLNIDNLNDEKYKFSSILPLVINDIKEASFNVENLNIDVQNSQEKLTNIDSELVILNNSLTEIVDYEKYIDDKNKNDELLKSIIFQIEQLKDLIQPYYSVTYKRLDYLTEVLLSQTDRKDHLNSLKNELNDILSTIIDNIFKPCLFHLAMRIQEGKFLTELNSYTDKDLKASGAPAIEKKYKLFSRITPVFVSTMHSLSNKIKYFNNTEKTNVAFIDLLIVDEAGQVSTETGAISLLCCKKALIVGDTYQIEPVYNIETRLDLSLYRTKFNYKMNEFLESDFNKEVWNCNSSSIMKVAQHFTPWHQYPELEKGLYLVEHNRCPIELISFCDELVYKNNLQYTITSYYKGKDSQKAKYEDSIKSSITKASYKLSRNGGIEQEKLYLVDQQPWKLISNNGNCMGNVRINKEEVYSILDWIDENYTEINVNKKDKKLNQIVAIITPFKKQANKIKEEGRRYDFKKDKSGFLNQHKDELFAHKKLDDTQTLTIGTVHSLQGAEMPIVLFSNVYGDNNVPSTPYIDRQPSIINVGVSRSKQSFYVFGNRNYFDIVEKKSVNSATAIMYKYIKKYE